MRRSALVAAAIPQEIDSRRCEGVEALVHVRTIRPDHDEIAGRTLGRHRRQRGSGGPYRRSGFTV
jgi:hypothetical protein